MTRILSLVGAVGIVLGLLAVTPAEQRGMNVSDTIVMLNGSPHLLGIITVTDGGSASNLQTQTRDAGGLLGDGGNYAGNFDAGWGVMAWVVCDGGAHVVGGTDSTVATGYDWPVLGDEKLYTVLQSNENAIAIKPRAGNASVSCGVFKAR